MPCNCIDTFSKLVVDELNQREQKPDGYKVLHSQWENIIHYPHKALYATLLVKSSFRKKNGSESVPRNESFTLTFTFCPFCGNKYES